MRCSHKTSYAMLTGTLPAAGRLDVAIVETEAHAILVAMGEMEAHVILVAMGEMEMASHMSAVGVAQEVVVALVVAGLTTQAEAVVVAGPPRLT